MATETELFTFHSVEVSRCMIPDYGQVRQGHSKLSDASMDYTMNLPIKIYWPETY